MTIHYPTPIPLPLHRTNKREQRLTELNKLLQPLKPNQQQRLSQDEAITLLLRRNADVGRYPAAREGITLKRG